MLIPRTVAGALLCCLTVGACASSPSETRAEVGLDQLLVSAQAVTRANYTFDAETSRALAQARVRVPDGEVDHAALTAALESHGFVLRPVGPVELKVFVVERRPAGS